jgi:hypothetical protein
MNEIQKKLIEITSKALNVEEDDYWPDITGLNNDVFIKWPENVINPDGTNSSIMLGYVIF